MFFQETTPDTSGYMIAGYVISFVVMGLYVASMYLRSRNLKQDSPCSKKWMCHSSACRKKAHWKSTPGTTDVTKKVQKQ
jgi:hypothetical protein